MKALKHISSKPYMAIIAMAVLIVRPIQASASNTLIRSTGVSDETLFVILALVAAFQLIAILIVAGVIKSIVANRKIWNDTWKKTAIALTVLFAISTGQAQAQDAEFDKLVSMDDTGFIALLSLNLFLFIAFLYLTAKLNGLMKMLTKQREEESADNFVGKINAILTDAVPVEEEGDVLMDHEYDGIQELDNNLPPWWLYGFYFSIAFAVVYLFHYHITGGGNLQIAEYHAELEAAEREAEAATEGVEESIDENNVALLTDAADLAEGGKTFRLLCKACHGETGGSAPGGVGPNLTDDYWIHGGSVNDIYQTIKYGVPEKGMVSWQDQLSPKKIQQLTGYIVSLRGSEPENAKEPQGELWKDETTESELDIEPIEPAGDSNEAQDIVPAAEDAVTLVD